MAQMQRGADLRSMFQTEDFRQVWIGFGSLIKIRTVAGVDDIMKECKLSEKLKEDVEKFCQLDYNWETIKDKGICYHTNTVILHYKKDKKQLLGYFQYNYASNWTKGAALIVGTGILVGSTYYFLPVVPAYFVSLLGYITQNHELIRQGIVFLAITVLEGGLCQAFLAWFSQNSQPVDTLIAACILKKLEGIMGHRV
jgi:hypothetical protein